MPLCAEKKIRDLICAVFVILVYPSLGWIVGVSAESIGLNPDVGAPKTVWIAMGLQKSDVPDSNNYGWYNGYPLKILQRIMMSIKLKLMQKNQLVDLFLNSRMIPPMQ